MRIFAAIVALCAAVFLAVVGRHWWVKDPRMPSQGALGWAIVLLVLSTMVAAARPSPYPPPDQFVGDRYAARQTQLGPEVVRSVKRQRAGKARYLYPTRKRPPVSRKRWRDMPVPAPRPPIAEPGSVDPLSMFGGVKREAGRVAAQVIGGRPSGCPLRFCGCGASLHLFGRIIPALNLAANWLRFPRTAPAPNMVAARRGHVFVLKRHLAGNTWLVHDSNSGGRRTRIHPRSIAGYVIVDPRGA